MDNRPPSSSENESSPSPESLDSRDEATLPPHRNDSDQPTLPPDSSKSTNMESSDLGNSFDDYELIEEIARGGMGVVYRARQKSLDRVVALKMILSGQFASEDEVRRFYAEATAAANLDHNNIVPIFDIGEKDGTHFFSMKLIEGSHLGNQVDALRGDLNVGIELLEKVCHAVHHAHQRGILHRDLKPGNILIDCQGEPYVTDLGLARRVGADSELTKTGAVVGTPSYMPPEQAAGSSDITTAADIYSLGAILYELLTGRPPFRGGNAMETLLQVLNEEPDRPSLSGTVDRGLELVAMKCLSKNPDDRYLSAKELANDLRRWRQGDPLSIKAPSLAVIAKNWMRKNFGSAGWILVVGLFAGIIAGFSLWSATVQQNASQVRQIYELLPSADAPWTYMPWNVPRLLTIPLMGLFTIALASIGFFAALLSKTKNTSADLAAGIIVGCIAGGGLFFSSLGTLSVLTSQDSSDTEHLSELAKQESQTTPPSLLEMYPEMSEFSRGQQVQLLLRKISADQIYDTNSGIWIGALCSLIIFLTAGIVETLIAGPIVRKHQVWWLSLLVYAFASLPFICATIIGGLLVSTYFSFGASGIVWTPVALAAGGFLAVGIIAELRRWNLLVRASLVAVNLFIILGFFVFIFQSIPTVARGRKEVANRIRLAQNFPDNQNLKLNAAGALSNHADALRNLRYPKRATEKYLLAIEWLNKIPKASRTPGWNQMMGACFSNRLQLIRGTRGPAAAEEYCLQTIEDNPDDKVVRWLAIRFLAKHNQAFAEDLFESTQFNDPPSLLEVRAVIKMFVEQEKDDDAKIPLQQRLIKSVIENSNVSENVKQQVLSGTSPQMWQVLGPIPFDQRDQTQRRLLALDLSNLPDNHPGDWHSKIALDLLPIDLRELLAESPERAAAFAFATIEVDQAQTMNFFLGSDDGAAVWLNGKPVHSKLANRPFQFREDKFQCDLLKGDNTLLIRIDQTGKDWLFELEMEDTSGWPAKIRWR